MVLRASLRAIALLGCFLCLAGCNTDDELAQQRLNMLKAQADSLLALKNDLSAHGATGLEGPGTVSIFISSNLVNSALKGVAGVTIPIPNLNGVNLTIKSVTADLKLGYPLVSVDAEATSKDLGLKLEVVGTARLETKIETTNGSQLTINVRLEELVPRAQWGIFDFKVGGFVKDLMKARASSELNNLASIQVPITTDIPLALPAHTMQVTLPGAKADVSTPAMTVHGHASVTRILVLPDGLHVYGTVSAGVAS
jgi:hypothetical protein